MGGAQQMHEQWARPLQQQQQQQWEMQLRKPLPYPSAWGEGYLLSVEHCLWGGLFSHGGHVNSMVVMEVWDPD